MTARSQINVDLKKFCTHSSQSETTQGIIRVVNITFLHTDLISVYLCCYKVTKLCRKTLLGSLDTIILCIVQKIKTNKLFFGLSEALYK